MPTDLSCASSCARCQKFKEGRAPPGLMVPAPVAAMDTEARQNVQNQTKYFSECGSLNLRGPVRPTSLNSPKFGRELTKCVATCSN